MIEKIQHIVQSFAVSVVTALGFSAASANYLYVFLISMVPIVELRGAIPIATALGLDPVVSYIIAILGNVLPVPFILLFITPFCNLLKKTKLFRWFPEWLERKVQKNEAKVTKYKNLGLFIFVAIPLPGTGAWTGALVASFIGYKFRDAFLAISGGVLSAGLIMSVGSWLVKLLLGLF
ncbi:MAG: small multi-drug export protein [Clostridia bacterium]|nr:small multi-drug export protein [Clostridia bacterium]